MGAAPLIDWESRATHLLLNPRMPAEERERLERLMAAVPPLAAHVWIATSGTTGSLKLTALSKDALLASAAAVNRHLSSNASDRWCCVLPTFHVGGLGIYARATLAGARVLSAQWQPLGFTAFCSEEKVTLSSLVPAQVRDLVRARAHAPLSLRAIVVGGGAIDAELLAAARELGWPLLPSYGMTECCSQIATATRDSDDLLLLDHLAARAEPDGRLAFRGASLLTGYALERDGHAEFVDPKAGGWFVSEDLGSVEGRVLRPGRRRGDFVKIGGESVDLRRLDLILSRLLPEADLDAAIFALEDDRLGHTIHLAATGTAEEIVQSFNEAVLPFERIRGVHRVVAIPRTELGKLRRGALAELVRNGE